MINDYDKFAKERQERIKNGTMLSHRFVEKPMMKSMLPDLTDKKILLIGCGTGEESQMLKQFGATDITGIDISEESIKIAKKSYPEVHFEIRNMNNLNYKDNSFDFIYSSLTIHYSNKLEEIYKEIYRILKPDGQMLFSVGHPMRWNSIDANIDNKIVRIIGFDKSNDHNKTYGKYNSMVKSTNFFPNNETLSFYVAPPSFHFKALKQVGFNIIDFTESQCIEEAKDIVPNYYARFSEIPQFMAFLVKK